MDTVGMIPSHHWRDNEEEPGGYPKIKVYVYGSTSSSTSPAVVELHQQRVARSHGDERRAIVGSVAASLASRMPRDPEALLCYYYSTAVSSGSCSRQQQPSKGGYSGSSKGGGGFGGGGGGGGGERVTAPTRHATSGGRRRRGGGGEGGKGARSGFRPYLSTPSPPLPPELVKHTSGSGGSGLEGGNRPEPHRSIVNISGDGGRGAWDEKSPVASPSSSPSPSSSSPSSSSSSSSSSSHASSSSWYASSGDDIGAGSGEKRAEGNNRGGEGGGECDGGAETLSVLPSRYAAHSQQPPGPQTTPTRKKLQSSNSTSRERRTVRFDRCVRLMLVPARRDLDAATVHGVWWGAEDVAQFRLAAAEFFLKNNNGRGRR